MNGTTVATEAPGILQLIDNLLRKREASFLAITETTEVKGLLFRYFLITLVLSAFYGGSMGAATLLSDPPKGLAQVTASALKLPVLYLLTTLVCFPVLYMVVVLMGSKLTFLQTLTTILLALALNSLLLASFAPIVWFFTITGSDYHFLKLLHVGVLGLSGVGAMIALWHGLKIACEKSDLYPKMAIKTLQVWILVFGFVGTQMAWSLRPFVGNPDQPFEIVRSDREGNFYKAVWQSLYELGN